MPFPHTDQQNRTQYPMVERKTELKRRHHRKLKMRKLKAKLAKANATSEKEAIMKKILHHSPWWTEPAKA